jgi:hypothetical protein
MNQVFIMVKLVDFQISLQVDPPLIEQLANYIHEKHMKKPTTSNNSSAFNTPKGKFKPKLLLTEQKHLKRFSLYKSQLTYTDPSKEQSEKAS